MLLSLVAHAGRYRMMVGAHNTVEYQDARERSCCLLRVWQMSAPTILWIPGGVQGVLPCSPGTVNVGAHNTVDASVARGGALPYLSGMGVDGAHNTVGEMSVPTILLGLYHAREVVGYCPAGV